MRNLLKLTVFIISAAVLLSALNLPVFSAVNSQTESVKYDMTEKIDLDLTSYNQENASVDYQNDSLKWNDGKGTVGFSFNAAKTGNYNLYILWQPISSGLDISLGVKIDNVFPFDGSDEVVLKRIWKNSEEKPRTDSLGNEYAQEQVEIDGFREDCFCDTTGASNGPYEFYITEGNHTLTLVSPNQGIEIKQLCFMPPEQIEDYKKVSKDYRITDTDTDTVIIQGEAAAVKTSASVIPKSNSSDSGMNPVDPKRTKINYIGGTSWQNPAERLTWKFKIEVAGYYYLNFRYKQSDLINGQSLRWLRIDDKTPFAEAETISFSYGTAWKNYTYSGEDGEPYYIYLDAGEHTLSLEVTVGDKAEQFEKLSEIVSTLGDEYIKIVMITGEVPDANRDYELFNQIPVFTETLEDCSKKLSELVKAADSDTDNHSTQYAAAMKNMIRVLDSMLKSPYVAQQYLSDYYSNYTALGSWLYDMVKMPLSLDEIRIVPAGTNAPEKGNGFLKSILYSFKRFLISFSNRYSFFEEEGEDSDSLRIWVGWGQDQASVFNSLINESFTKETGIKVRLEMVNTSLVNGILSGNFPDLAIQMARTEPVNLGIRGALYDLHNFEDCDEVLKRFQPNADLPYRYDESLYALPDTQSFMLMFYRTDIFENLGLTVPKNWDEFLETATVIQRNNMSVYMPYTQITTTTTVNSGIGSLNLFPTLMAQSSLSIYNDELNSTNLVSKESIEVFKRWTEFYTEYDFYKEADFYNRFRVGSMPLGIAPYSMYMTLYSAAREIGARWSVATVPATKGGNDSVAGAGTGCAIIAKSSKKAQAWEFLKWWTSADTQVRFTNNVESILGMIGRISTSNVEALSRLSWSTGVLDVLLEEWSRVTEVPEVPGSYYLTRCVDQAFWSVVNGTSRPKDALIKWSNVADDEIIRKINEYK